MKPQTDLEELRRRANKLRLYGLLAHWDEVCTEPWALRLIELEEETDTPLTGTAWTLDTLISNEAASSLPADVDPPTLEIAEDGTVTLFSGCNTGGGTAVIGEDTLELEPLRLTMMACEGEAGTVEAAVLAVLDGTVEVAIDGKVLILTKGDNALGFRAP